jgi:hypothetical protein
MPIGLAAQARLSVSVRGTHCEQSNFYRMRTLGLCLVLCAAAVSPLSAQDAAPAADRTAGLIGTWQCESFRHSNGTWTFVRNGDGSIALNNKFRTDTGLSGEFAETYSFDPQSGLWNWASTQQDRPGGLQEDGKAKPWTAETWTFDGRLRITESSSGSIQPARTIARNIRMVYTTLGPDAFRRDMETFSDGRWVSSSASTCKRASA